MPTLAGAAIRLTSFSEKYVPDAFIFALLATGLAVLGGLTIGGANLGKVVQSWGDGFWGLIPFTMQMALVIITGTVVATAAPVARAIDALASIPTSNRGAVVFVAVMGMSASWLNWGFGVVFAAVLVRAVARKVPGVDYRTLAATAMMGTGSIWAQGLSGSAALQMATPGMLQPAIRQIVETGGGPGATTVAGGIIPLTATIFLPESLLAVAIEMLVVALALWFLCPTGDAVRTAADLGVVPGGAFMNEAPSRAHTPGEWFEHQHWLNWLVVLLAGGYLVKLMLAAPSVAAAVTLNALNLAFLTIGMLLHGTPARFIRAFKDATPHVYGVILQFPFYAGIAAIIVDTGLNARIGALFTGAANHLTFPALVAAYSAVLGVFVPSGGSKWVIEAPYVIQSAHALKVHLGWTVVAYDLGEALANLIQPFWMLPVLGMLGLKARDIIGVTFGVFLILTPVVLLLVTVLGAALGYPL
ncbi:MAG TPA: TIGR00366 family protein [Gemmatimonadales bacterium]|nr:TIGR00366 family protein [Gemmatimonadales bacterium]